MRVEKKQGNIVMVADDDLFVRKILRSALQNLVTIVETGDGADVEKLYKDNVPDVLFLDIHLPNKTGLELIESIKEIDPDAYIIMVSADSSTDNVKISSKHGVKGFMTKPFNRDRVLKHVMNCPTVEFMDV